MGHTRPCLKQKTKIKQRELMIDLLRYYGKINRQRFSKHESLLLLILEPLKVAY